MLKPAIALLSALLTLTGAAGAEEFRPYLNARFGVSALVPKSWTSLPPPENGDGLNFVSPDQHGEITVTGMLNFNDDPKVDASRVVGEGERIAYQSQGPGWVVASGEKDGRIFYRKSALACRGKVYADLSIVYPAAEKAAYDQIVKRVAGSFRGGCGIY